MEERIDNYITGKMTPEEILQFRKDLNTDMQLREEYERVKEISDAIQRKALKDKLVKEEKTARKSPRSNWRTLVYSLSAAASLALFVNNGASYYVANQLKDTATGLYAEMEAPVSRSANEVDELLESVYESIGQEDYSSASKE